jgi:hypothetical protein
MLVILRSHAESGAAWNGKQTRMHGFKDVQGQAALASPRLGRAEAKSCLSLKCVDLVGLVPPLVRGLDGRDKPGQDEGER